MMGTQEVRAPTGHGYALAHGLLVIACLTGGYVAHFYVQPVTAALALVFAVVLTAARYGLRPGIAAGVVISLIYNLVLSDPVLQFGLRTVDDLIPLLVFNISAVASAYLAGRLRDEARVSREARERVASLLGFSQQLQQSVGVEDMLTAARQSTNKILAIELHVDDGRTFAGPQQPDLELIFSHFQDHGPGRIPAPERQLYMGERFRQGLIVALSTRAGAEDVGARLAILAIAAERWLLTESLVAADVLRRSEDFKTTLLSSVSHDLRTPLAVISASAGSLLRHQESLATEAQRDLLDTIEQQASRLNRLTSNLLSLVRIEGGLDRTGMPASDAIEILGSALVSMRQIAPDRKITKDLEVREAVVRADPSLLEQVFTNILMNAVVHTPEGSPIHIAVAPQGSELLIALEDCGPGVRKEESELIFERFHQVSASGGKGAGSGLGLSIARGFARTVGGDVTVSPRLDGKEGSRFLIRLPLLSWDVRA